MAWDMAFNIQWAQRIEKEERAFLASAAAADGGGSPVATPQSRHHRARTGGSRSSTALSTAGESVARTPSSPSLRGGQSNVSKPLQRSRVKRASTGGLHRSSRSSHAQEVYVPEHLQAVARFPVVDKDLMTARVEPTEEGKVPKVKFHTEQVKAMWWPGRASYTKFHPEFCFEDPPDWTPEDILRERSYKRATSHRTRSNT